MLLSEHPRNVTTIFIFNSIHRVIQLFLFEEISAIKLFNLILLEHICIYTGKNSEYNLYITEFARMMTV